MTTTINYAPLRKAVLDVIEGGVDEDAGIVPSTRLDANRLVDEGMLREVLVRDRNGFRQGQFLHHPDIVGVNLLCLLRSATSEPSALQTTYFTGGVVISASVFCC